MALSALSACQTGKDVGDTLVPVQLAVRVGDVTPATKGDASVITEMDRTFRGMTGVTIIPFDKRTETVKTVQLTDVAIFHPSYLPDISKDYTSAAVVAHTYARGLVSNNNAHLYSSADATLPGGTTSVLAYGYAPDAQILNTYSANHTNGALNAHGIAPQPDLRSVSEIGFDPVPIFDSGLPDEALSMASVLNNIVSGASFTADYWYNENGTRKSAIASVSWDSGTEDNQLRELFSWITNNGELTTGSGVNVEYMITYLYRMLKSYVCNDTSQYERVMTNAVYYAFKDENLTDPLTLADLYYGLRDVIVSRIEYLLAINSLEYNDSDGKIYFTSPALCSYPDSYGLPAGAAVIKWDGVRFNAVAESLDGVSPLSSFCYPPKLWYYANSTISTSTSDQADVYTSENDWTTNILGAYRTGKVIHSDTKSVALDEPLQYSCGMLLATVRASASSLDDADGSASTLVRLTSDAIEVTGVIIGGQRSLRYDFTPVLTGDEYFLYDNCISNVYLQHVDSQSEVPAFRTLVSQTPDGAPVYFCLELRNNTGGSFTGADGIVLPGSKFYLLGTIPLPTDGSFERVFEKDFTTTINCTVTSLAEAHTAVPDLQHPTLSMGLQVNVNWMMSTPSYIVLY